MDKNLHNIDEIFSDAHKQFVEQAPDNGWEKLQAGLDKQDADKYRRRFIGWKRIAILLLLLLSGFIIYETGVIKSGRGDTEKAVNVKPQPQNNSLINTETVPSNDKNKIGEDLGNTDESSADIKKKVNPDNQKKNLFSPQTIYTDSITFNPSETFILTAKNKKYDKQKTKISIKPGVQGSDDETGYIVFDKTGSRIKKNKPAQAQADKENDITAIEMPGRILAEIITLPRTERKIVTSPGIISKPALPLITLNTAANTSKKRNQKFKPYWIVTPFISSDWGMYQLDNDVPDNTGNTQNEKEVVSKRERHESSYSAGTMITRQVSKHTGVKTGFVFSNTVIAISPQEIYAVQENGKISYKYITSSGYGLIKPGFGLPPAIGDSIKAAEAQHNLQVISIPFSVSYRIDKKKFSIIPSAGLSANFITSAKVKTEVSDALNKETENIIGLYGMKRFYTGFIADVNVQYNINNKLAINLLPTFKYAVSPITKNNVVKTYPYSFGLGAGLTFKF
jgi:hypothetical protein